MSPQVSVPSDVLNSATWASLSLEGFWDILNAITGIRPSNGWKVTL